MKKWSTLFIGFFVLSATFSRCYGEDKTTQWAKSLLSSTKPVQFPLTNLYIGLTSPEEKLKARESYEALLKAISVVGDLKQPPSAHLLVLFLDYPVIGGGSPFRPMRAEKQAEDIALTRSEWPALSALLEIPGSSKIVSAYALDKKNPIHNRLAAFHALRYYNDQADFNAVTIQIKRELANAGPETKMWLKAVEENDCSFQGSFPLPITR